MTASATTIQREKRLVIAGKKRPLRQNDGAKWTPIRAAGIDADLFGAIQRPPLSLLAASRELILGRVAENDHSLPGIARLEERLADPKAPAFVLEFLLARLF